MKRTAAGVLALMICMNAVTVSGQETDKRIQGYRKSFEISGNDVKLKLLNDEEIRKVDGIVPLYLDALTYVINNITQNQIGPIIRDMGLSAVSFMKSSGKSDADTLMLRLFQTDRDNRTRIAILEAFGAVAAGDRQVIDWMNAFLLEQNAIMRTGTYPDIQVMTACVQALSRIGDPSSFPVVFDTFILRYTDEYTRLVGQLLLGFKGNLKDDLIPIITSYSPTHKLAALDFALASERLMKDQKLEISHVALRVALSENTPEPSGNNILRDLRRKSIEMLTKEMYTGATADILKYFDLVVTNFNRGTETVNGVLEAVASLGKLGNHEAAVKLTQFLDLINLYTEKDRPFDDQITLAVIRNLGILADTAAFDSLILATYLNYSDTVKKAAREANMSLKW